MHPLFLLHLRVSIAPKQKLTQFMIASMPSCCGSGKRAQQLSATPSTASGLYGAIAEHMSNQIDGYSGDGSLLPLVFLKTRPTSSLNAT
jgi:hypothetical protein